MTSYAIQSSKKENIKNEFLFPQAADAQRQKARTHERHLCEHGTSPPLSLLS